jgi:hypothetical protein
MRALAFLRTPRPRHAFAVSEEALVYGFLDGQRSHLERVEQVALPPGTFQLGPVGLLQVKGEQLQKGLQALLAALAKPPKRASLVVPDAWLRALVLDLEALPSRREEAEEVIRWRLKKLLPCRPEEVRLDYVRSGENGQVLVLLGLDKPLATLEESFAACGCHLGSLEPLSLALSALLPQGPKPTVLVSTRGQALSIVVTWQGRVQLSRLKLMPAGEGRGQALALRELSRTAQFLQEKGWLQEGFSLVLGEVEESLAKAFQLWALEQKGVEVRRLGEPPGPQAGSFHPLLAWGLLAAAQPGEGA